MRGTESAQLRLCASFVLLITFSFLVRLPFIQPFSETVALPFISLTPEKRTCFFFVLEQYHPVIDIGAGNLVTVVFQKGFRLETIEDADDAKAKEELQKAGNAAQNAVTPQPASQTTASSTTSVGNINPDDVLRQASQLRLGDTIN